MVRLEIRKTFNRPALIHRCTVRVVTPWRWAYCFGLSGSGSRVISSISLRYHRRILGIAQGCESWSCLRLPIQRVYPGLRLGRQSTRRGLAARRTTQPLTSFSVVIPAPSARWRVGRRIDEMLEFSGVSHRFRARIAAERSCRGRPRSLEGQLLGACRPSHDPVSSACCTNR